MKTDRLTYSFLALREKLYRSAMGFLKNDEDARDALQDTFFKLWNNSQPQTDTEARNKLFLVLRNICIDRLRKPTTVAIGDAETGSMVVEPAFDEDMERVESMLTMGLTDNQLRNYKLITDEGMEYDEIASNLTMSVEAVRMNMSRARKKLRDNYKKLYK